MLIPFRTVKESIELVNNSKFGAGVSIHSQDISLGFNNYLISSK
jgi:acyl-CoA reductase-like NAD-dependent aldehyde dehydrogenase